MTKNVFKTGLSVLLQVFPNKEIQPEVAWPILNDLSDNEFQIAIINIISTQTEIYPNTNMIALIRQKAKETPEITAGEAWGKVLKEVSRTGSYGIPQFENKLIQKAVDCVGWKSICQSECIGVERGHFLKVFESLEVRERKEKVAITFNKDGHKKINQLIAGILQ